MFSKDIIDSDAFLEMPISSQNLYFHLCMRADDDGFVNGPKKIMRVVGCGNDDLKVLLSKRYVLGFESGVIVIKHWRLHNYIQKDRYKPTLYREERALLSLSDNGSYTDRIQNVSKMDTECIQDVSKMETQGRLGKVSLELGKERGEEGNTGESEEKSLPPHQRFTLDFFKTMQSLNGRLRNPTEKEYLIGGELFKTYDEPTLREAMAAYLDKAAPYWFITDKRTKKKSWSIGSFRSHIDEIVQSLDNHEESTFDPAELEEQYGDIF